MVKYEPGISHFPLNIKMAEKTDVQSELQFHTNYPSEY